MSLGGAFPFLSPSLFTLASLFFVIRLVRITSSWDRPGRRAKGSELATAATVRTADWKRTVYNSS